MTPIEDAPVSQCSVEATCEDREQEPQSASATVLLGEITQIANCDGVLQMPPCPEPFEPHQSTLEHCETGWGLSPASQTCNVDVALANGQCRIEGTCTFDRIHYPVSATHFAETILAMVNCEGLLQTGDTPCDSEPIRTCTEEWLDSQAFQTCPLMVTTQSWSQATGTQCQTRGECYDAEGDLKTVDRTTPVRDVSELHNCTGELVLGGCP